MNIDIRDLSKIFGDYLSADILYKAPLRKDIEAIARDINWPLHTVIFISVPGLAGLKSFWTLGQKEVGEDDLGFQRIIFATNIINGNHRETVECILNPKQKRLAYSPGE